MNTDLPRKTFLLGCIFFILSLASLAYSKTNSRDEIKETKIWMSSSSDSQLIDYQNIKSQLTLVDTENFVTGYFTGTVWLQILIENHSMSEIEDVLAIEYPMIDKIDFYEVVDDIPVKLVSTGLEKGRSSRQLDSPYFGFNLKVPPQKTKTYLISASSKTSMSFPLKIKSLEEFNRSTHSLDFRLGIYVGFILLLIIYNFSLGITTRDRSHLLYAGTVLFFHGLTLLAVFGYPSRFFWPEAAWLSTRQHSIFEGLAVGFSLLFANNFLDLNQTNKKISTAFKTWACLGFISAAMGLYFDNVFILGWSLLNGILSSIASLVVGGYAYKKTRSNESFFFFLAWTMFLIPTLVYCFKYIGLIQSGEIIAVSVLFGAAIEAGILSIALGFKIRKISFEKFAAQAEALRNIKFAKEKQDNFIANTSHELRTPVGVIMGLIDLVLKSPNINSTLKSNAQMIKLNANKLYRLVEDLLTAAKLKKSKLRIAATRFCLKKLVTETTELLSIPASKKSIRIKLIVPSNEVNVFGDRFKLGQVLANLVDNAIKFSDGKDIAVTLELENKANAIITVEDNGIGISNDQLQNIFVPFMQAEDHLNRSSEGLGLGLHIAKQIIEIHKGCINVNSTLGEGTKFTINIPTNLTTEDFLNIQGVNQPKRIPSHLIAEELHSYGFKDIIGKYRGELIKILLVEDNDGNKLLLTQIFNSELFDVAIASDAYAAMKIIEEGWQPDLAIIDVMLPKIDGISLTKKIRENLDPTTLPIVLLTAKSDENTLINGFKAGANEFISKPVNEVELLTRVRKHLELADLRKAANQFVPSGLVSLFEKKKITDLELGTFASLEKAVLFSDIRNFSSFSESVEDEDLYKFIMSYLLQMSPIVRKHNGFIDKFIGDAIMAIFDRNEDCLNCAVEMIDSLKDFNKARIIRGRPEINIGIGLHAGDIVAGIIGNPERLEATVLGDKVNTASRLEAATKYYNVDILASEYLIDNLDHSFSKPIRFIDKVRLYGKNEATELYEIVADPSGKYLDSITLREMRGLIGAGKYQECIDKFSGIFDDFPNDPILSKYQDWVKKGEQGVVLPFDPKGNYVFSKKSA